jgi:hypothetical protein
MKTARRAALDWWAMTLQPLRYAAPPPPAGSAEVLWRGNDFDVTLPPRADRRLRRLAVVGATVAVAWWIAALVPLAFARAFFEFTGPGVMTAAGVAVAAGFALLGARSVYVVLAVARQARMLAHVSLRDGMLIFEVPAVVGVRTIRRRLATFNDADVRRAGRNKNDDRQFLVLRRPDGESELVLNDLLYRRADLMALATAIRTAIVKNGGGL